MIRFMIAAVLMASTCMSAGSATAGGPFNPDTMLGWQRETGAAAVAYGNIPFHATKHERKRPHFGFAMTAPVVSRGQRLVLSTSAPRFVDFQIAGADAKNGWTASLRSGATPVWSNDPNVRHLLEGDISWVAVGVATVAVAAGILTFIEDDVPPPTTSGGGGSGAN